MQYQVLGVPLIIIYVFDEENSTHFLHWTLFRCVESASFLLSNPKYKKVFSIPKAAILFPGDNENKTSF